MIDFKMTDIDGRWRHITIPVERFGEDTFTYGIGFEEKTAFMAIGYLNIQTRTAHDALPISGVQIRINRDI